MPTKPPAWIRPLAALGLAWSGFGIVQFFSTSFKPAGALIAKGMTPAQAALYAGLPGWMTLAFALGVFGGTLGCVLLLARHRLARPVLMASLAGYAVLFAGDIAYGVFAAFGPPQVLILSFVLLVAAGLVVLAGTQHRSPAAA
jgi:hypothetical protein